jgi:hypothetical protein
MSNLPVSQVVPDFQLLYNELQKRLEVDATWKDLLPTNVGSTILDMFAATGVPSQFAIEMGLREAFFESARRDSSIFSGARGLGVRIARRSPASTTVELTIDEDRTVLIPPYSKITLNGSSFFNRTQALVAPGAPTSLDVYEGVVAKKEFDLDVEDISENFNEFIIGIPGFRIADTDISVWTIDKISGAARYFDETETALFEHKPNDSVYYEMTTGKGDVALLFGDGTYGRSVQRGQILHVSFVVTQGASANNGTKGITGSFPKDGSVSVETLVAIKGGADEKSAKYYKLFASNIYRSKKRTISHPDYVSNIAGYAGVADVAVLAQKDIAPDDPRWMNMVRICVLPATEDDWGGANPNPKSAAWKQFLDWFKAKHGVRDIQTWNPTKLFIDVKVKLFLFKGRDKAAIELKVLERMLVLFLKKPGILGRKLAVSDLKEACNVPGVDYMEILSPEKSVVPELKTSYVVLRNAPVIEVALTERVASGE